jgi:endonuclease VIII
MPEGDTIRWHANRIAPALVGRAPDRVQTHERFSLDRWPEKLTDRTVTAVDTHGKHLFIRFDGGLTLHSHLGMVGTWGVYGEGRRWGRPRRRAWLILGVGGTDVVQFDGSTLELVTDGRTRFDQRLAALGPDVLADEFDAAAFLKRLRGADHTRGIGDALLDQTIVAGIGNMWKAEACWDAEIDPWRKVGDVSDAEALTLIEVVRPRMRESAVSGPRTITPHVYGLHGRPCSRCGTTIRRHGQGDDNRTTHWCPGCQR